MSVSFFRLHQWNSASPNLKLKRFFSRLCSRRNKHSLCSAVATAAAVSIDTMLKLVLDRTPRLSLSRLYLSSFLKLTSFHQTAENKCCLLIAAAEQEGKFQLFLSHLHVIFGNTEEKEKWNLILDDNKTNAQIFLICNP